MKQNFFMSLIVCFFLAFVLISCNDDSACDRAESSAKSECTNKGYSADCSVTSREKDYLNNTTTCKVECKCYKNSSRNSSEFEELMKTVYGSCTMDDEGNEVGDSCSGN
jgi:hypothetical protein